MDEPSIAATFGTYFELKLATQPELLEQIFQVRYQVYCQEFQYEQADRFPDGMERDEFDAHAQQALMIHRPTGRPVGCIRLIEATHDGKACILPFESFCPSPSVPDLTPSVLPRERFGEMSRLAVVEAFRRRKKDEKRPVSLTLEDDAETQERRSSFPFIPVGLFMAGMSMFLRSRADFAVAMMEPRLARLLQRFGLIFTKAGEVVDYHGARAPFVLPRDKALSPLLPEVSELLTFIDRQLYQAD